MWLSNQYRAGQSTSRTRKVEKVLLLVYICFLPFASVRYLCALPNVCYCCGCHNTHITSSPLVSVFKRFALAHPTPSKQSHNSLRGNHMTWSSCNSRNNGFKVMTQRVGHCTNFKRACLMVVCQTIGKD